MDIVPIDFVVPVGDPHPSSRSASFNPVTTVDMLGRSSGSSARHCAIRYATVKADWFVYWPRMRSSMMAVAWFDTRYCFACNEERNLE